MLPDLSSLRPAELTRVLRHTVVVSVVAGALGVVAALALGSITFALGIVLGLGLALVNQRFLDASIARIGVPAEEEPQRAKTLRRAVGGRSMTRLVVITGIAIGLMFLDGPLGIGTVTGLVIFQIVFVANVGRVVLNSGVA